MMGIFCSLGNDFANSVWEARLVKPVVSAQKEIIGERWNEGSDDNREVFHPQKQVSQGSTSSLGEWTRGEGVVGEKPGPSSSVVEKEQFVRDKYIFRKYIDYSSTGAQRVLWNAVQQADLRLVCVWKWCAFPNLILATCSCLNICLVTKLRNRLGGSAG